VCQIARIFPDPVDHSASKESLYELRIAKFFGNDPEAPVPAENSVRPIADGIVAPENLETPDRIRSIYPS
jgi:hypothetical protein